MVRLFKLELLNILSFIKTYPSGMEEKLSLNTSIYTQKRFHGIHCKTQVGLTPVNFSNTHLTVKKYIRTISSLSEYEPVLVYNSLYEHKGLIIKQNKGKSGVYR